jgi:ABC-2 type transport system permease protein
MDGGMNDPHTTGGAAIETPAWAPSRTRANLVALTTIARREAHRVLRIWTQTLVPPAITMTLYFVIFGKVIGSRIGVIEGGFTYMQYIVPGLVMMSIINNCYSNITSSFFGSKFGRYVEELLASPMPSWVVLTGYVAGAVMRGVLVGIIVLGIALFFTSLHVAHPLVAFTTVILGATIFSLAGFINAIFAKRFDDIAIVPTFVLAPLTYLGGVFYSVNMLGSPWREASLANPILYMVNAFRFGILGISDVPIWIAYLVMLAFVIVLGGVALWLLNRGVGLRS